MPARWEHSSAIGSSSCCDLGRGVGEECVQRGDDLRAFSDAGRDALHRAGADVADREDAAPTGFERAVAVAEIASGHERRTNWLHNFYFGGEQGVPHSIARAGGLKKLVSVNIEGIDARGVNSIALFDDEHGRPIYVRVGKNGPYLERMIIGDDGEPTPQRANLSDEVDEVVGAYAARFNRDELFALLSPHHIPCAPVRDLAEVTNDPHLHQRGMLEWMDHPKYGRIAAARSPLRFEHQPLTDLKPSAELGEHNTEVYEEWLGLSKDEVDELKRNRVI
jgi:hypothetical protein